MDVKARRTVTRGVMLLRNHPLRHLLGNIEGAQDIDVQQFLESSNILDPVRRRMFWQGCRLFIAGKSNIGMPFKTGIIIASKEKKNSRIPQT